MTPKVSFKPGLPQWYIDKFWKEHPELKPDEVDKPAETEKTSPKKR